jgi:hypothetical protein
MSPQNSETSGNQNKTRKTSRISRAPYLQQHGSRFHLHNVCIVPPLCHQQVSESLLFEVKNHRRLPKYQNISKASISSSLRKNWGFSYMAWKICVHFGVVFISEEISRDAAAAMALWRHHLRRGQGANWTKVRMDVGRLAKWISSASGLIWLDSGRNRKSFDSDIQPLEKLKTCWNWHITEMKLLGVV